MKLLYTHENSIIVENAKSYLDFNKIQYEVRNEFSQGAIGELSPIETWPEIWVDDDIYQRAFSKIEQLLKQQDLPSWFCSSCEEENAASFEICWNCQSAKL